MFSPDDTIVAIATPPGRGGLGIVRISGPESAEIASALLDRHEPLRPRHATLSCVRGIDQAITTLFAAPHSYTGQDVVEISVHGSPVVLNAIVEAALRAGARLAEPGEFTFRAFLNRRLDLVQAEAVADLIEAVTPRQARAAFDQLEGTLTGRIAVIDQILFDLIARLEASLDFANEGYHFIKPTELAAAIGAIRAQVGVLCAASAHGRLIREGAEVVIVGRTNAGKSSVFNRLAGQDRAIVADQPGTTRDLVTERVDISGVPITLVDTAGFRNAADAVEREGVARARKAIHVAGLVLVVVDGSMPLDEHDRSVLAATGQQRRVVVVNKCDVPAAWEGSSEAGGSCLVRTSARTGEGFSELRAAIVEALNAGEALRETPAISNIRHIQLLKTVATSLGRAEEAAASAAGTPEEFVLSDLQQARHALEEITGARTTDDLLRHIFDRFCIGK
ncbi:MAG: tRNA uridine-5-carboxymethylaminomethyl(34) synthesis GTPase MnmE [Acidobacteria bacterium]|nr:tRNA uridine-5-carboxymethylaminomethyl(34) synthesis GTPase MnmE [Acidobacteriota bacterium]